MAVGRHGGGGGGQDVWAPVRRDQAQRTAGQKQGHVLGAHICGPGQPRRLNECDDPGLGPRSVGQSASVAAGDLGGGGVGAQGGPLHFTWFRLPSLAVCVGLHGNTSGGFQAFSGIRYGGSCCKFNELVAHCCLGGEGQLPAQQLAFWPSLAGSRSSW